MRSRAKRDRGRAAVGRGAVVRLRRQTAEDEMDVGADREVLRRHRAPAAADRHARRDRREVGAQHAGVDELAGQQPLEVVAPGRRDAPGGDRDDVGGRAADVDQQRVGVRAGDRERRRHPVGGGDVPRPRARRRHRTRARRPPSARSAAGRRARPRAASSTNATPSRLVRNASDSSAVIVIATACRTGRDLGGDLAQHRGERLAVAPDLERARDRPQRRPVAARRPSCSRRRCPPLAWPACASSESSISRPARRFTPCAASANVIARSAAHRRRRRRPARRSRARSGPSWGSTSSTSPTSTRSAAQAGTSAIIAALAREARVMVDAGVSEPERARALLDLGAHRVDRRHRDADRRRRARPAARGAPERWS